MKKTAGLLLCLLLLVSVLVCCKKNTGNPPQPPDSSSGTTESAPGTQDVVSSAPPDSGTDSVPQQTVWRFTLEPAYDYADVLPLSLLRFFDSAPYVARIDTEKYADYLRCFYYKDNNGKYGVLLPDGSIGLPSELDISWCPVCNALCSAEHDLYDSSLKLTHRSGHGGVALFLDAADLSVVMATEGGFLRPDPSGLSSLSGVFRVLDPQSLSSGDPDGSGGARYAILRGGVPVTHTLYDGAYDYSEGMAAVMTGGNWYYIDTDGNTVIDTSYAAAYPFSRGMAAVKRPDGKAGYINARGRTVIPFVFEETRPFTENGAWVRYNGKWGIIEYTG